MSYPVAILAGGIANRLRPLTDSIPKSLVDVGGRPFIERQLDRMRSQGITHVVVCVAHLGEQIEAAVGTGKRFGLSVRYSWDGDHPLGTGGALRRALPLLGPVFFVQYGDSFVSVSYAAVADTLVRSGKPALMTAVRNQGRWDTSNSRVEGGLVVEYDKRNPRADMEHVDYGLGMLSATVFEDTPEDTAFDLGDIYHDLSIRGELACHEVTERIYEIGSPAGLRDTTEYFRNPEER